MPAPWTPEARRALDLAAGEARALGHAGVRTGHLLLGLLAEPCAAARAVAGLGLTLEGARDALRQIAPPDRVPGGDARLPLAPVLQVLTAEQAAAEAAALEHRQIGTMHLLLALTTATEDSSVIKVLARLGVTARQVRDAALTGPRSETAGMAVRS